MKHNLKVKNEIFYFDTKYGEIEADFSKKIILPKGLIGLPSLQNFVLSKIPNDEDSVLRIFHCLDNEDITFVVLPIVCHNANKENDLYETEHLNMVLKTYNLETDNTLMLIIAKQKIENNKICTYLNIKAPVLVNVNNYQAIQHVFLNKNYLSEFLYKEKIIKEK